MQRIVNDIKAGAYQPVYLLFGEERYLKKQYRDKLKTALCDPEDTMNTHFYTGKGISTGEIIDLAETLPFFADRRNIIMESSILCHLNQLLAKVIILVLIRCKKEDIFKNFHSIFETILNVK